MKYRGPIITLLAVATLAAVLLVVNLRTAAQTQNAGRITGSVATGQAPVVALPPGGKQPAAGTAADTTPPTADTTPPSDELSAPPPATEDDQPAYAGRTSGNEATIAIVVRGDEASAYICDGEQVESWLEGTITDGALTLQGGDDARADGSVQGDAVFGTLWVQGKQWPYAAQRAERPAGLYQGEGTVDGAPARIGWIVLQDGSQVGIADIGGVARPAPALDPYQLSSVEVGGSTIVPRPVNGADNVANPPS
ncbi:MAG: hypothetical protein ACRDTC_20995 [Pseudonocardiaceae bacterium]